MTDALKKIMETMALDGLKKSLEKRKKNLILPTKIIRKALDLLHKEHPDHAETFDRVFAEQIISQHAYNFITKGILPEQNAIIEEYKEYLTADIHNSAESVCLRFIEILEQTIYEHPEVSLPLTSKKVDKIEKNLSEIEKKLEVSEHDKNNKLAELLKNQELILANQAKIINEIQNIYPNKIEPPLSQNIAEAIKDIRDIPNIESSIRLKGGQAIIDALIDKVNNEKENLLSTYKKIAEWSYLIGNLDEAEKAANTILNLTPNDTIALYLVGLIKILKGYPQEATEIFINLIRFAQNDENLLIAVHSALGNIYEQKGDTNQAFQHYAFALDLCKKNKNTQSHAITLNNLATLNIRSGNYDLAANNLEQALIINNQIKDLRGISETLGNLGNLYADTNNFYSGNVEKAEECYFESLKIKEKIGDKRELAITYANLGIMYKNKGKDFYKKALSCLSKSLKLNLEMGIKEGVAGAYMSMGTIYDLQKNLDLALEKYLYALDLFSKLGYKNALANTYFNIGVNLFLRENIQTAKEYWKKALIYFEESGNVMMAKKANHFIQHPPFDLIKF
ncbi:MAG: tetratricopeptide repeat protein [Alphaproteobacteria bacterium]|nr:tetratricopeptide repeat protein [Alphaproteobacteria bacterium]MBP7759806.1 tetratricopeptide repeat protein [Alphaproteobacteria bacterium]MBP7763050.1 tetratricopeptide repeat protein [Alphaproteobacteria bacterium]MBP7905218.1 tetratricopeptide repeat protein [Alphaproteobacteria bacterium]